MPTKTNKPDRQKIQMLPPLEDCPVQSAATLPVGDRLDVHCCILDVTDVVMVGDSEKEPIASQNVRIIDQVYVETWCLANVHSMYESMCSLFCFSVEACMCMCVCVYVSISS